MKLLPRSLRQTLLLLISVVLLPLGVQAATPGIETFARLGGTPDGFNPNSVPVQGTDGNFYDTTRAGGPANCGTIYRVAAGGVLTTLYAFTDTGDGSNPSAGLILGPDGNFYGTTPQVSGGRGQGTVFRVTPAGVLTTLHQFSAMAGNPANADRADPETALLLGADGNFYGTTETGGAKAGGTVFEMTPAGVLTTLASFDPSGTGAFYGPQTALVQGSDGNFYGTAQGGSGFGVIYKTTPAGVVTLLHTFAGAADGGYPGALLRGDDGNFYGLAAYYVSSLGTGGAQGTAFQITPAGALTTLHGFNYVAEGGIQGSANKPPLALIQGADGNFYGAAGITETGLPGERFFA